MAQEFATLVGLCLVPGIGGVTLRSLLAHFGTVEAIRQAPPAALQTVPGVGPRITEAIRQLDPAVTAARIERWRAAGIGLLTWSDLRYPALLRATHDAPPLLFYKGILPLPHENTVAIVGSRQPASGARRLAEALGEALAARGWIVVSGLAWGIDMATHSGALQAGQTVAVLGGGVDQPQPKKRAL
ncbi:MAG: DNA-protecting protein DprA, partial [Anaerolineae bacterium]|nr:DNA-protecting protein DprA [Anaerolineae bacterium]